MHCLMCPWLWRFSDLFWVVCLFVCLFFFPKNLVINCFEFFCNEMSMIYFSSFDVSFVLFYPCRRNLSDLAIFIYLMINLQIKVKWIILLGMTSKFRFMYLHLKQYKNGVFNLYCMPELYFVTSQVSVASFRWDDPWYIFSTAIY